MLDAIMYCAVYASVMMSRHIMQLQFAGSVEGDGIGFSATCHVTVQALQCWPATHALNVFVLAATHWDKPMHGALLLWGSTGTSVAINSAVVATALV